MRKIYKKGGIKMEKKMKKIYEVWYENGKKLVEY